MKIWTEDTCPICEELAIKACRCPRNERWCINDHHWRRDKEGEPILCGKNHTDLEDKYLFALTTLWNQREDKK